MAQLNMEEREVLSRLHVANYSRAEIAARLSRPGSTIGRELQCNGLADGGYSSFVAEVKDDNRRLILVGPCDKRWANVRVPKRVWSGS